MPGGQRVLGHALEFGRDPLALFQQAREHGDVVRIRFGPFHVYVLNSPGAISPYALNRDARLHRDPDRFEPDRWGTGYSRSDMRATFFPFGQGIRNCIGEGFAWTESILLLSVIAAHWQLRLADGASVRPVVSSTLVPSELPMIVTRRR
jgi:cytochrome P450